MTISVVMDDITDCKVDAIVNAANTTLLGGGGVDGAIHAAAGPELLVACKKLHGCPTGEAKITKGYQLPAKYVIHTPGPIWHGGTRHEKIFLQNSYRNSLLLAEKNGCETVAFPSISTGVYNYPIKQAAPLALNEIHQFMETAKVVKDVTMVCFDEQTFAAYQAALANLDGE